MKTAASAFALGFLAAVNAEMNTPFAKANKAAADEYSACGTTDKDGATVYIGACKETTDFTYGYVKIEPVGFGLARTSDSMAEYSTSEGGTALTDWTGGFAQSALITVDDAKAKQVGQAGAYEYGFATMGGFQGISGLAEAGGSKAGGFIGTSLYMMTEGSVKVSEGLYRGGEIEGTVYYSQVPYAKGEATYNAGDVKMNIYGWSTKNDGNDLTDYAYFGTRFSFEYVAGTQDAGILPPAFTTGSDEMKTLMTGEYMDDVKAITFKTRECEAANTCLSVDLSALDVLFGSNPTVCAQKEADVVFKSFLAEEDRSKTVMYNPKECFTNTNVGKLQVNVKRATETKFEVDFIFKSSDFMNTAGGGSLKGGGRYMVFDPSFNVDDNYYAPTCCWSKWTRGCDGYPLGDGGEGRCTSDWNKKCNRQMDSNCGANPNPNPVTNRDGGGGGDDTTSGADGGDDTTSGAVQNAAVGAAAIATALVL